MTTSHTEKAVEKLDHSYIAGENVKQCNKARKEFASIFRNLNIQLSYISETELWGLFPIEIKTSQQDLSTVVYSSSIFNSQKMEISSDVFNREMVKQTEVHV